MKYDTCVGCGSPVICRADGKVLDAVPHRLGINRPDEGALLPSEVAKAFHGTGPLLGHIAHHCSPAEQQALFELALPPQPARRAAR